MGIWIRRWAVLAPLLVAGAGVPARAVADAPPGDAARGARLAYTCFGCHGIPDYRNAYPNYRVPRLGGQHAPYIVAALTEYRAGTRAHPTMKGQASSLGEQDIQDLAAYFAATRPIGAGGAPTGAAPVAAGACAACHGATGIGTTSDFPTLAGQYPDYLEQALKAYRKGGRQNPIMGGFAATLKDEDIHALARYFAAQQPGLSVPLPPSKP
jgi:cytochrome c553